MILELRTFYFPSGNILVLCLIKKKKKRRKKVPNSATENAEKTDFVCHIYYRILEGLKRFKDNGGGGKRRGSQIQEGKAENTFCKHLKRKSSQS